MNREIKFRGKRKDNGEWVYGLYHNCKGDAVIRRHDDEDLKPKLNYHWILTPSLPDSSGWDIQDTYSTHEVEEKTVSQFTGFKDENGKEIYEGDILETLGYMSADDIIETWLEPGDEGYEPIKSDVQMICGHWCINYEMGDDNMWLESHEFKVIGNIHDNPQLLTK